MVAAQLVGLQTQIEVRVRPCRGALIPSRIGTPVNGSQRIDVVESGRSDGLAPRLSRPTATLRPGLPAPGAVCFNSGLSRSNSRPFGGRVVALQTRHRSEDGASPKRRLYKRARIDSCSVWASIGWNRATRTCADPFAAPPQPIPLGMVRYCPSELVRDA